MLYKINSWAPNSSWVDHWWGLEGLNAQEHGFLLGQQQEKVPGVSSTAQRVKPRVSCLARPVPDPSGQGSGPGRCSYDTQELQLSPSHHPNPQLGPLNMRDFGICGGSGQIHLLNYYCHEFVMPVLFLQVKPLSDNRSTGWHQLIEGEFYPRIFFLDS